MLDQLIALLYEHWPLVVMGTMLMMILGAVALALWWD